MVTGFESNAKKKTLHLATWRQKWVLHRLWFDLGNMTSCFQPKTNGRPWLAFYAWILCSQKAETHRQSHVLGITHFLGAPSRPRPNRQSPMLGITQSKAQQKSQNYEFLSKTPSLRHSRRRHTFPALLAVVLMAVTDECPIFEFGCHVCALNNDFYGLVRLHGQALKSATRGWRCSLRTCASAYSFPNFFNNGISLRSSS